MDPKDFCRWLQGMFDISKLEELSEEQIMIVRKHLNIVFKDETGCGAMGMPPGPLLDSFDPLFRPNVFCSNIEEDKTDPYFKENSMAIFPSIRTVVSC